MLSVQTLARRIRQRLHDTDEIAYYDDEILDCINCGLRFIRRNIAKLRPALLMSEHKGTLQAEESSVTLEKRPTQILNVTVGALAKPLQETEMALAIHDGIYEAGEPRAFFLTGSQTINFYPAPSSATDYTIRTIDDIEELDWEGTSPLSTEFDDFLIEYANIRLSAGNEYDVTQEAQLMANIAEQIRELLAPPPSGIVVQGYWNSYSRVGGYR